jgi:hypothetical protein
MVKMFEQANGNVALLVAGYSALDTRRAARVIAEGTKLAALDADVMEVEVAGTTLTQATVSIPEPEPMDEGEGEAEAEAEAEAEGE